MEVVTRRQSGDLTHVLCVEKERNTCSQATQKELFSSRCQSVPEKLEGPPPEFFFSLVLNAKVKPVRVRKEKLSFYLKGLNALCNDTKALV